MHVCHEGVRCKIMLLGTSRDQDDDLRGRGVILYWGDPYYGTIGNLMVGRIWILGAAVRPADAEPRQGANEIVIILAMSSPPPSPARGRRSLHRGPEQRRDLRHRHARVVRLGDDERGSN